MAAMCWAAGGRMGPTRTSPDSCWLHGMDLPQLCSGVCTFIQNSLIPENTLSWEGKSFPRPSSSFHRKGLYWRVCFGFSVSLCPSPSAKHPQLCQMFLQELDPAFSCPQEDAKDLSKDILIFSKSVLGCSSRLDC